MMTRADWCYDFQVHIEIESEWYRNRWRFARLFSPDYDDLVGWYEYTDTDHRFGTWKNSGDGKGGFTRLPHDLEGRIQCPPAGLHFIDMNADGLDDIACVHANGDLYLSVNRGDGGVDHPPSFNYIGRIMTSQGKGRDRVVLGDIDGDGRGDYGHINDDESVTFWRNSGTQDKTEFWQALGVRSTMKFPEDRVGAPVKYAGLRFEDVNGDGRDDWMWLGRQGQTTTWTNARSCKVGREGDGLNVAWRQAFAGNANSGPTHAGMADFNGGTTMNIRGEVHFARVFGTKEPFGNFGLQDYVYMEHSEKGDKHLFKMNVWKNKGAGGTKLEADGNKYCNMIGHGDGREDYVWTWSTGKMHREYLVAVHQATPPCLEYCHLRWLHAETYADSASLPQSWHQETWFREFLGSLG